MFSKTGVKSPDTVFFVPHGDEATAHDVLKDYYAGGGTGEALVSRSASRNGRLSVDPNQTLRLPQSDPNRQAVEKTLMNGPPGQMIVALHNTFGGAFDAEKNRSDAVSANDPRYGGYILTTDKALYDALKGTPYNVILQNTVPANHDFSTSRWAAMNGKSYTNVEAVRGDYAKQKAMLRAVMAARSSISGVRR